MIELVLFFVSNENTMNYNSFFKIKSLCEELHHYFEDLDPSKVDHEFFSKEIRLGMNSCDTAEDALALLIKKTKEQFDHNLIDSRTAVNQAIQRITTPTHHFETGTFKVGSFTWEFNEGQVFLLSTNANLSTELYQHIMFDLAVNQKLPLLCFVEKTKHDFMYDNLVEGIKINNPKEVLNYNASLTQLKMSRCHVEFSLNMDQSSFLYQLSYLINKHQPKVIYIDDNSLITLSTDSAVNSKDRLRRLGELLLSLANEYNVIFFLKWEHEFSKIKSLPQDLGNILNYTQQALHFNTTETDSYSSMKFFNLYDLKRYPLEPKDCFYDRESHLISTTTSKDS